MVLNSWSENTGWQKGSKPLIICCLQEIHIIHKETQIACEMMENNIGSNQNTKSSRSSLSNFRESYRQTEQKRQRRTLHIGKREQFTRKKWHEPLVEDKYIYTHLRARTHTHIHTHTSTSRLSDLINTFGTVAKYTINTQQSVIFL